MGMSMLAGAKTYTAATIVRENHLKLMRKRKEVNSSIRMKAREINLLSICQSFRKLSKSSYRKGITQLIAHET